MENKPTPPPNPNEEVDLIALFEYFRKGFWNFFNLILSIFKFFFNLFVRLFMLLKKNWMIVGGLILACAIGGYFYSKYKPKQYYYEMILRANYNSVYELYNFVESLEKDLENEVAEDLIAKKTGLKVNEVASLEEIGVEPVEDFEDVVSSYYGAKGSPFTPVVRDSIFYQTYTIEDYQEEILQPIDFSLQRVYLLGSEEIEPKSFEKALMDSINKFSIFDQQKRARLQALNTKEKNLRAKGQLIDSLLLNLSKADLSTTESSSISLRGDTKSNVEDDLLNQSRAITDELFSVILQKEKESIILQPVSSIRLVEKEKWFELNLLTGTLIGFLLSLLLLLSLEANRALDAYAAREFKK